ncbi:cobalamin-binding protein [Shewanella inventionis]|uniref:Cobalamin-binding protein n=1 Tax=Shewanella inventionis TaxID=1738770 RepID=A0ABQ1JTP9_9GAMM|nr:cobalamin-binding protein [Shewanella inventionis]GGB74691.1 cobalamin-binding protein [Shewanella inventionis]
MLRLFYSLSLAITLIFTGIVSVTAYANEISVVDNPAVSPAKRIIALSPQSVEMLFAIGAGDSIVATTDYADYPEQAKKIPSIGGSYGVQIERVIELNPDLVVVWQSGNKMEDIKQLQGLGFNIVNSDPKTLADVASDLELLGKLTGHSIKAKQVADDYRQQLADIKQQNQAKPVVKVFYQLWSTPLMTVAKGSWIQNLIDVCHGENVFYDAASEYPQISIENVLLTGAEVILQSQDEGNVLGINWADWPELPAVKKQHIYQFDADLLHRATPRAILGVNAVCEALDKVRG